MARSSRSYRSRRGRHASTAAKPNPNESQTAIRVVLAAVAVGAVGYGVYRYARKSSSLTDFDPYGSGMYGGNNPYGGDAYGSGSGYTDGLFGDPNGRLPDDISGNTPNRPPVRVVPADPVGRNTNYGQTPIAVTPIGTGTGTGNVPWSPRGIDPGRI